MPTRLVRITSALALLAGLSPITSAQALEPQSSTAQPASGADVVAADNIQVARALWKKGVKAFQKSDFETARVAFARCYAFMPKVDVLRNLSISEVESGHYVSAARHLTQLLGTDQDFPQKVKDRLEGLLARSEAQVGQLSITSDIANGEIWVDGEKLDPTVLGGTWYVEPGRHTVLLRSSTQPDSSRRVYAMAGVSIPVEFLRATMPVRTVPNPARAAVHSRLLSRQTPPPLSDQASGLSTANTVAVATGGVLTAVSLAAATYFTTGSYRHSAKAEALTNRLKWQMPGGANVCGANTPLPEDCAQLQEYRQDELTSSRRAKAAFIGFGITGAATLTYALILAIGEKEDMLSGFTPLVDVHAGGATFGLHSRF